MLEPVVLQQIIYDYQTGQDHETLILNGQEREDFFEWFGAHAVIYPLSNADPAPFMDAHTRPGRCYGNAQTVARRHGLTYVEGFFLAQDSYVFHGFNLLHDEALDVSVYSSLDAYCLNGRLPDFYCGIKIPDELIAAQNGEAIDQNIMNIPHLLHRRFRNQ